jgi:hypothetical protein
MMAVKLRELEAVQEFANLLCHVGTVTNSRNHVTSREIDYPESTANTTVSNMP